jgi:hypothetical protein
MSGEELVILDPEKLVLEATLILKLGGVEHSIKLPRSLLDAFVERIIDYGYYLVEEVLRDRSVFEMKLREKYRTSNVSGASECAGGSASGRSLLEPLLGSLSGSLLQAQAPLPQAGEARRSREEYAELIFEFMFERLSEEGKVYEDDVLKHVYGRDGQTLPEYEVWGFRRLLDNVVRKRLERALGDVLRRTWDERGRAIYVLGKMYTPPRRISKAEVVEEVALSLASKSDAFSLKELVERCIEEFRRRGLPVSPQEDDTVRSLWRAVRRRVERRLGISLEERREGNRKAYCVMRGG